jgi:hypothetical protein
MQDEVSVPSRGMDAAVQPDMGMAVALTAGHLST